MEQVLFANYGFLPVRLGRDSGRKVCAVFVQMQFGPPPQRQAPA